LPPLLGPNSDMAGVAVHLDPAGHAQARIATEHGDDRAGGRHGDASSSGDRMPASTPGLQDRDLRASDAAVVLICGRIRLPCGSIGRYDYPFPIAGLPSEYPAPRQRLRAKWHKLGAKYH